jgi:CheY-like chemotaxis protein
LAIDPGSTHLPVKVVLIADDNVDAAETLRLLLAFALLTVHIAHDGLKAIELAEAVRPDVAVLDISMPGANGFDVARWIRKQPWGRHVRLVALTAWATKGDIEKSREAGFDTHLRKPAAMDELTQALCVKLGL